ncbi:MAG: SDR family NAD(P)-dependent oxidoreductase [Clostridia bacterium]|nr:SDR family NAD(P)-dependent oxidoreductase [Clostridia bacterium]
MRTAFITGGSGGIGSAIVKKLKKCGYNVVIGYFSNEEAAFSLAKEVGAEAAWINVTDTDSVKRAFDFARKKFGRIGVLVNCAGIALKQAVITDVKEKDFDRVFLTNVKGVFNCCKEVVSDMLYLGYGDIINVSSVWGEDGASCEVVYSASKGAVNSFTVSLAKELEFSDIKVNAVAPSFVKTRMNEHLTKEDEERFLFDYGLSALTTSEEVADEVIRLIEGEESGQIVRVEHKI